MDGYRVLVERVLSGNKKAFGEIVARFRASALAAATARHGDPCLAEDAVQEAFLAAFIKLPLLREPEAFPGWFRTILSRHCERIRARHKRAIPSSSVEPGDIPAGDNADPGVQYLKNMDRVLVRRILASLPNVGREACIQHYVHGRSCKDISQMLGVPPGTVKRRLHDARRKIASGFESGRGRSLRLGYLPISDHLLAMVVHHRHDKSSFDLRLSKYLSWTSLVGGLTGGMLDAAFVMAPLAMHLRNRGAPIRYLLDGHHDGSAVTVHPSTAPRGLGSGSTMALPHSASTHSLLLHALLGRDAPDNSGNRGGLNTRFISPSYVISSLARGEIDGFLCSEPWHTKSVAQGEGRILARSRDLAPGHICCVLVATERFAALQPELLHYFLAALKAAGEFITAHPAEAAAVQSRYTGVDRGVAEHILAEKHITFTDLAPDRGRAEQVMNLALASGVLKEPCDLKAFMASDFL